MWGCVVLCFGQQLHWRSLVVPSKVLTGKWLLVEEDLAFLHFGGLTIQTF